MQSKQVAGYEGLTLRRVISLLIFSTPSAGNQHLRLSSHINAVLHWVANKFLLICGTLSFRALEVKSTAKSPRLKSRDSGFAKT
jgi:hypothetical protein